MNDPATIEKRVAQFIAVRDHIKKIKERQKEELKQPMEILEKLNSVLLGHLNANNLKNAGCAAGTVYKTTKKNASIADASAFWEYIVTNGDWDMIDKKANTTAVEDYITEHGTPPPGVNFTTFETVGVQRGK